MSGKVQHEANNATKKEPDPFYVRLVDTMELIGHSTAKPNWVTPYLTDAVPVPCDSFARFQFRLGPDATPNNPQDPNDHYWLRVKWPANAPDAEAAICRVKIRVSAPTPAEEPPEEEEGLAVPEARSVVSTVYTSNPPGIGYMPVPGGHLSVLIEGEEEVPDAEKTLGCGPDATDWFEYELGTQRLYFDHLADIADGTAALSATLPKVPPPTEAELVVKRFALGLPIVRSHGAEILYGRLNFYNDQCPKGEACAGTVSLCDHCIHDTELGNILFGVLGASVLKSTNTDSSEAFSALVVAGALIAGGTDKREDLAGVLAGIILERSRQGMAGPGTSRTLCGLLRQRPTDSFLQSVDVRLGAAAGLLLAGAIFGPPLALPLISARVVRLISRWKTLSQPLRDGQTFIEVMSEPHVDCSTCKDPLPSGRKQIDLPASSVLTAEEYRNSFRQLAGPGISLDKSFPK